LVAPARCCLKNAGRVGASDDITAGNTKQSPSATVEERLVERAFVYLTVLSAILKDKFGL
jgi:hypothetical protein